MRSGLPPAPAERRREAGGTRRAGEDEGPARTRGLVLPPEAFSYLFSRAPRDMRNLAALLLAIDRYSLEHKRPITLPLLREVLQTSLNI